MAAKPNSSIVCIGQAWKFIFRCNPFWRAAQNVQRPCTFITSIAHIYIFIPGLVYAGESNCSLSICLAFTIICSFYSPLAPSAMYISNYIYIYQFIANMEHKPSNHYGRFGCCCYHPIAHAVFYTIYIYIVGSSRTEHIIHLGKSIFCIMTTRNQCACSIHRSNLRYSNENEAYTNYAICFYAPFGLSWKGECGKW